MTPTVTVNGLTVVHKASDGRAIASAPDVCKTPTPNGPAPMPYPNLALTSDLVNGTESVTVDGQPVAVKDSELSKSAGDEAGTLGGITSGVNKGKAKFSNYSMDVCFEDRNVARLSDPMTMNGNQANTATVAEIQQNLQDLLGEELLEILCKAFCWCNAGKDPDEFVQRVEYDPWFT